MPLFISRLYIINEKRLKKSPKVLKFGIKFMLIFLPQQWRHQQAFIKFIFVTRSPQSQRSIVLQSYPQIFACVLKNWGVVKKASEIPSVFNGNSYYYVQNGRLKSGDILIEGKMQFGENSPKVKRKFLLHFQRSAFKSGSIEENGDLAKV